MTTDLTPLLAPEGVVVIGASRQAGKLGAAMARSLACFPGARALVNARRPDPAEGVYASVAEAAAHTDGRLDLAVLCVPASGCAQALAEAAAAGCRAALVCAGGFGEAGPEGEEYADELRRVARETGVRLLGPNTSGFFAPHLGLTASFVPAAGQLPAGDIAVVAASGGVNHALAFDLVTAGNGISLGVGIGAGLDVTAADVLDHLVRDDRTTAVALHLETVPDGPRLVAAVRGLAVVKPVVALVVGRSDIGDFARSHTGALATSWRTTRAALRQAGAVVVDDERELVDALTALSRIRLRPLSDPGLGIVTAQAGPGLLLADRAGTDGIRVPELTTTTRHTLSELLPPLTYQRNPVDTGRPAETFARVLDTTAADPAVDLLAVYALTEPDSVDLASAAQAAGLGADSPAVVVVGGLPEDAAEQRTRLHKAGVPALTGPASAANAVRALVTDARQRSLRVEADRVSPAPAPAPAFGAADTATTSAATAPSPVALARERGQEGDAVAFSSASALASTDAGPAPSADARQRASSDAERPRSEAIAVVPLGPLDEDAAKTFLAGLGIRTPDRVACDNRAEAHQALRRLGGPVAVKVLDAAILHKTEIGGVHLGVRTAEELDAALDAIGPDRRYLVEAMAPAGVDLVLGVRRDPVFGPVVLAGLGGTAAEALADVAIRLAPLSVTEAATMPDELAARVLLDGWRGGPVLDRAEFGRVVAALAAALAASSETAEIEINPLRLTADGLIALDAVIVPTEESDHAQA
ncbi:acetate--CoA ligase family protein [Streptomyces caniscabiei]|uniref:Acetate--CoA ligase family protein n=1 Tax=Streptomyces caniscabiei TaxID=2746961 RepID=A0ABU4MPK6_9ACTN|nr:acetate--CoA ligase family protein [Streptomyces caniscabiei]MDX2940725.1 acetate--CoA ligase family protein [Streptomyces caniscabiei]MDX2952805.1 acetate--CoA ligase family protein [Streptomyces caniscabiei]MDX2982640.1 acetate--CoA ligase family protein [Streptomyces caniscabiei]MDX3008722.1 acetate--CoA ligase family protein [Streptomyces caniscabiei]MDX3038389.1 acetate--CoA ligase family protein [Streptomyces caniscabiei]